MNLAVAIQWFAALFLGFLCHFDTYGTGSFAILSIPEVPHEFSRGVYSCGVMNKKGRLDGSSGERQKRSTPYGWGPRFREMARAKGLNLAKLAERMGLAESALRHWTNGTREVNLTDFLHLCASADLDPATILFAGKVDEGFLKVGEAWGKADPTQRGVLRTAAEGILAQHAAIGRRSKGSNSAL